MDLFFKGKKGKPRDGRHAAATSAGTGHRHLRQDHALASPATTRATGTTVGRNAFALPLASPLLRRRLKMVLCLNWGNGVRKETWSAWMREWKSGGGSACHGGGCWFKIGNSDK
ncbi:uncharacterized protein LOC128196113 [Vigna angularis]|uniref:uncharacterized protein LOC128196113 n=1 Tax=Phaseolus angularis TaxID=3914 RepID=UPI0022B48DE1|nr:uncharacterized protein LOC128196113 [Vigna angularis]